jgi:DNA-binding winged helix-turn-helix (wHTH) protein
VDALFSRPLEGASRHAQQLIRTGYGYGYRIVTAVEESIGHADGPE